jgi:hypothetical protein
MISIRVLSIAAALALVAPMAAPSTSLAAGFKGSGGGRPAGVGMRAGPSGGNFRAGPSGGNFRAGAPGPQFSGGPRYGGGGGYYRRGGGGFIPGAVAGAVIGGAIASGGYYGAYGYAPGSYDDQYYDAGQYYDPGAVAVVGAAPGGDDAVAYCMQTYRSYDPRSGTYLGNDGYRHPCP